MEINFPSLPERNQLGPNGGSTSLVLQRNGYQTVGKRRYRSKQSGIRSRVNFQDVKVRRPILAVSDSTKVGNLLCFDEEESVIMPRNCEEGKKIRELIGKARRKVTLELEQGVYTIPAWVVPPEESAKEAAKPGFPRQGGKK